MNAKRVIINALVAVNKTKKIVLSAKQNPIDLNPLKKIVDVWMDSSKIRIKSVKNVQTICAKLVIKEDNA